MSDQVPGSGESDYATPTVTRKRQNRISWIWLVPVVAALMGLSLVVRTWLQAGPEISISFNTAEGLEVGKTQLRYKDVNVGTVQSIGFNEDRSKVVVKAELAKEVADLAREGTNFWVVRPRLGVSGVSGLGTLLSGAYIGVDAPNDQFVTSGTRFWNASGVDFSVNADGLKVRTQSLVSMAVGGVAFEPVYTARGADQPAPPDAEFQLYGTEAQAKANPDAERFDIRMRFDQSIRGLAVGAPVDFSGITLGNVTAINLDFDDKAKRFYSVVDATLYPERLGRVFEEVRKRAERDGDVAGNRLLAGMIGHGLRAQLRTANLLTGQLFVSLDVFPNAKPVEFKPSTPAVIPTVPGNLDQLQQQVSNIVAKIEKIPFDKIGEDLRATLSSTSRLMNRLDKQVAPQAQAVFRQAKESLAQINALVSPDGSLPVNAERAMQELGRAARSLRALADFLQSNPEALLRGRGEDPIPGAGPVRN